MDTINRVQDWARCKRELLPPHHPRAVVARHHSFRHACIGDSGERSCPNEGKQGLIETQDRAGFAVANWDRRVRKKRDDAKMEHGKGGVDSLLHCAVGRDNTHCYSSAMQLQRQGAMTTREPVERIKMV